ncbi:MAG: hypothetical protein RIN55_05235 [Tissierellaceae bacterium]|nr:hypothetical protein [Tissierellaceae bacterium]
MGALYFVYIGITAILCLLTIWELLKEKSLYRALSLGLVSIPLILRTLMIK